MRVRFAKQGDLRFSSHRDLLRVMERLFRRAEVAVRQSEGFHPKPRFMFPSALALGVTSRDEVFDVDLLRAWEPAELVARLAAEAPPGLSLLSAEFVPPGGKKAQASRLFYELPLPVDRVAEAREAVDRLNAADSLLAQREGREAAVDLRATLEELSVVEGVLRMTLRAIHTAQARPRDILEVLGLADLEFSAGLVRSRVELEPWQAADPRPSQPSNSPLKNGTGSEPSLANSEIGAGREVPVPIFQHAANTNEYI